MARRAAAVAVVLAGLALWPASAAALDTAPDPTITVRSNIPAQAAGDTFTGEVADYFASNTLSGTTNVTIDWGDGSPLDTTTGAAGPSHCAPFSSTFGDCGTPGEVPTGAITGSHTFQRTGPFTITVTVSGTWGGGLSPVQPRAGSGQGIIPAAAGCAKVGALGYASLKLLGAGCITTVGTRQSTPPGQAVAVNGLELYPQGSTSLVLNSATGTLSSEGGAVGMRLGCGACGQRQTSFIPHLIDWRVVPNPGEAEIGVGSTGRFSVDVGGFMLGLPALSANSVTLTQNQKSNANFTVGLPLTKLVPFFGVIKATATVLSDNATGAHFDGLDATIAITQKPELSGATVSAPFKAFSGNLKFKLSTNTWDVGLNFTMPGAGGVSATTQIVNGAPTEITFDASYKTPGLAIGDTGAFLQGFNGSFVNYPRVSRPRISVKSFTTDAATNAARLAECANYDRYYDQYIAIGKAFPSYCEAAGLLEYDPPLEVNGGVRISAGPVIGRASALIGTGSFRFVDSYFDGYNKVPWLFNVQGNVSMVGLPFNRTTEQVYGAAPGVNKKKFIPVDNAGQKAWATIHGDGQVEAGGGFNYAFPQNTGDWLFKVSGDIGVSLIPKGALIGAPPPGATPESYANVAQGRANNWAVVGTVEGSVCAQIPTVATACANGAAGVSNIGVAGCASFSLPGSDVLQKIAIAGAKAINALADFGQDLGLKTKDEAEALAKRAKEWADETARVFKDAGNTALNVANTVGDGFTKAGNTIKGWFSTYPGVARAAGRPVAHSSELINTNIKIPDLTFAVGALYNWQTGSTNVLTSCSHDKLKSALSSSARAHISAQRGVPSLQVRVHRKTRAPRIFVIRGATAAPDVIVLGPDRRIIRTSGPGFVKPPWIVYKDPRHNATYVDVADAPKGKWSFVRAPGSSRILDVQTAGGIPIARVGAGVQKAGKGRLRIVYKVRGRGRGQVVRLVETDGATTAAIGRLKGSKGKLRWRPSTALVGSKRVIIATVKRGNTVLSAQRLIKVDLKKAAKKKPRKKAKKKR